MCEDWIRGKRTTNKSTLVHLRQLNKERTPPKPHKSKTSTCTGEEDSATADVTDDGAASESSNLTGTEEQETTTSGVVGKAHTPSRISRGDRVGTGTRCQAERAGAAWGNAVLRCSDHGCLFHLLLLLGGLGGGCHLVPQRGGKADTWLLGRPLIFCTPPQVQRQRGPGLLLRRELPPLGAGGQAAPATGTFSAPGRRVASTAAS